MDSVSSLQKYHHDRHGKSYSLYLEMMMIILYFPGRKWMSISSFVLRSRHFCATIIYEWVQKKCWLLLVAWYWRPVYYARNGFSLSEEKKLGIFIGCRICILSNHLWVNAFLFSISVWTVSFNFGYEILYSFAINCWLYAIRLEHGQWWIAFVQ